MWGFEMVKQTVYQWRLTTLLHIVNKKTKMNEYPVAKNIKKRKKKKWKSHNVICLCVTKVYLAAWLTSNGIFRKIHIGCFFFFRYLLSFFRFSNSSTLFIQFYCFTITVPWYSINFIRSYSHHMTRGMKRRKKNKVTYI